jgi:hypothetical protein
MDQRMAKAVATALAGETIKTGADRGVGLTRTDGRYLLILDRGGAVFLDEPTFEAAHSRYDTNEAGYLDVEIWDEWGSGHWAYDLGLLLGSVW